MKRIFIACFCLGLLGQAWADTSTLQTNSIYARKLYIGAGAGILFPNVTSTNNLGTGAGWPDDYYGNQSLLNVPSFSLMGGYTWARQTYWLPYYSVGLRVMSLPTITMKGYVDQYSLPDFRNYNYNYDLRLLNILATLKVDIFSWNNWMPYLMASAGVAHFRTSNYIETATTGVTPRISPGFSSNSGNNFAYGLGFGVDYIVRENLWVTIGYTYNNFGTVSTGNGADTSSMTGTNYDNESLKNTLSASTLSLEVTYYIG